MPRDLSWILERFKERDAEIMKLTTYAAGWKSAAEDLGAKCQRRDAEIEWLTADRERCRQESALYWETEWRKVNIDNRQLRAEVERLRAVLREARQYVSDAGCDEDHETQTHSCTLLDEIDAALTLDLRCVRWI